MKWEKVKIENLPIDLIDGDRGTNYPKINEFYENEYCLFLNTGNVLKNGFDFSKCQFINQEKDEKLRKGKISKYDIVLTTRGTLGNVGFYSESLKSLKFPWPAKNAITEFNEKVEQVMKLIFVLAKQNAKLCEARVILLPRLMSGQIEV